MDDEARSQPNDRAIVPEVNPADIKAVWTKQKAEKERLGKPSPGQAFIVIIDNYRPICSPGADLVAVTNRLGHLNMLQAFCEAKGLTLPGMKDGNPTDAVFKAFAVVPVAEVEPDRRHRWTIDLEELIHLIRNESGELQPTFEQDRFDKETQAQLKEYYNKPLPEPAGPVPEVDPADFRAMWNLSTPGPRSRRVFPPSTFNSDMSAVMWRHAMLFHLRRQSQAAGHTMPGLKEDGEPSSAVFRAFSAVPMMWRSTDFMGSMLSGDPSSWRELPWPFDVNELFRTIEKESREAAPDNGEGERADESVPQVDPADLKTAWAWQVFDRPGPTVELPPGNYDTGVLMFRYLMLYMLQRHEGRTFPGFLQDGEPSDAVFKAFAAVPMTMIEMQKQYPPSRWPFDMEELTRLIQKEVGEPTP
jgi:hypothetical protein